MESPKSFSGLVVHEDVVQLGVVVGHPQGQSALPQGGQGHGAVRLPVQHELDFGLTGGGPAQGVGGDGVLQLGQAVLRVVEVGDGLVQGIRRVVLQQLLEPPEGPPGGGEQLRRLGGLVADGVLHEGVQPPRAPLAVGEEGLPVFGADDLQGLPAAVAAVLLDLPAQVVGDADDVLHKLVGPLEGGGAHPLEDEAAAAQVFRLGVHHEGVVDVPLSEADGTHHGRAEVEGVQGLVQHSLNYVHVTPPTAGRGTAPPLSFPRWRPPRWACPPGR